MYLIKAFKWGTVGITPYPVKQQAQARSFAVWLSIFLTFVCTVWSHLGHCTVVGYLVKYIPSVVAPRKNPSVRYKKTRLSFSLQDNRTLHFKTKKLSTKSSWDFEYFYILMTHTGNAQVFFVLKRFFKSKSVLWFWFRTIFEKLITAPPGWQTSVSTKISVCITSM